MKNKIPNFLLDKFKIERKVQTTKFPDEIKKFMLDYSKFYNWNLDDLISIFKIMKQGITEIPVCEYPSCEKKKQIIWNGTITKGCCKEHTTKITNLEKYGVEHHMLLEEYKVCGIDNIFSNKNYIESKVQEKYGVTNVFKSEFIKNKIKKTMFEKYGCENPSQSDEIMSKKNNTWFTKYGCHPFQNQEIKNKIKQTNLIKYGVEQILQSEIVKEKIKLTNIEKYGYIYPTQNVEIKEKTRLTNLERYDADHPMQNDVFYESVMSKSYNHKEFTWNTGEKSRIQGYENKILEELEKKGYTFNDVLTSRKDMPKIWYMFEGKKHRYYPDFYIPKENLIIEVKSNYTLQRQWNKNQAKFQAVKDAGYQFKLEVR